MAFIAHVTFWVLLAVIAFQVGWRRAAVFLGLWVVGYVGSGFFPLVGGFLFGSYVAVLDLVLLFMAKLHA